MKHITWKPISGYEGYYEVSSNGQIKSLKRWKIAGKAKYWTKQKLLKLQIGRSGYYEIGLSKHRKTIRRTVHRLVCETFHGKYPADKPWTNHKNGNRLDNDISNLEQCSASENEKHSYDVLGKVGPMKGKGKSIVGTNKTTGYQIYFDTPTQAAESGFNRGNLSSCLLNNRQTTGGYSWKYKEI